MKSLRFNFSALLRPVRLLLATCVCALLLFSQVMPAYSSPNSNPTSGEANLLDIERKSQEAVLADPYSREKTQTEANKGLNEIQGDSNIEQMKRPENTPGGKSVEDKLKNALEGVTGNK
ncbi:MAG: low temperature-induced protein [Aphanothece sp. CMT-3BRIN-NPC111]|nr:low temperature-induced protein [Aphanothece sp. CMT-3BRIN-NPC111]